jgi:maleylacetate reductase
VTTAAFTYDAIGGRVVFGVGSRQSLPAEVDALGATRVVLIAEGDEPELAAALGDRCVARFGDVVQHVPADRADAAAKLVDEVAADCVVTVGGGSATGFGKAVRLAFADRERSTVHGRRLAFVAVPTTYAGSEMTTIWGRTDSGHKHTGKHPFVKPDTVVYDPELTLTLPARIAGPSGMNALAHCVEALYGPGRNPVVSLHALAGIRALAAGLPVVCGPADSLDARSDVLYGAYLAGIALASGGTALHHKTCHVLGGMFNLDHGDMNAVLLGHAVAYNAPAMPAVMDEVGAALGIAPAGVPEALFDLAAAIGAPTSLAAIGMPEHRIAEAAERVVAEAAANVRTPDAASIEKMLTQAFHGQRPEISA